MNQNCQEIEELEQKYDYAGAHKKVKQMVGKSRHKTATLMDKDGKVIIDDADKLEIWKDYILNLFGDTRSEIHASQATTGPSITRDEILHALRTMKSGKVPGPDNIYIELLKLFDDNDGLLDLLTELFNDVYDTGQIPSKWLISTFLTIPKKTTSRKCDDYRLISLINHITKLFLKVIHRRIYSKCEEHISETQFGFREGLGTREAIFSLQVLIQRCRDVSQDVHICFIDFSKAFDNVRHDKLIQILKTSNIDEKDIRVITNLYWEQRATVKLDNANVSEEMKICRGVRQGCVLSPTLFNLYSEGIFREALEGQQGIKINGQPINNIRYADDTAIIASSLTDLQQLVERVKEHSERYGLNLNISKTKYMLVTKRIGVQGYLTVNGERVQQVHTFSYLGITVYDTWDYKGEVLCRIEKARATFLRMRKMFIARDLTLNLKIRMLRCYVFSVLLYGVESWTVNETIINKLNAFELWCYRRILKVSWTQHITNEEIINRIGKKKEIVQTLKERKLQYLGHIMRHDKYRLLQLILQGKIEAKRGRGRRRHSWMKNLRDWFGLTTTQLFRAAVNRVRIAMMLADVRNG